MDELEFTEANMALLKEQNANLKNTVKELVRRARNHNGAASSDNNVETKRELEELRAKVGRLEKELDKQAHKDTQIGQQQEIEAMNKRISELAGLLDTTRKEKDDAIRQMNDAILRATELETKSKQVVAEQTAATLAQRIPPAEPAPSPSREGIVVALSNVIDQGGAAAVTRPIAVRTKQHGKPTHHHPFYLCDIAPEYPDNFPSEENFEKTPSERLRFERDSMVTEMRFAFDESDYKFDSTSWVTVLQLSVMASLMVNTEKTINLSNIGESTAKNALPDTDKRLYKLIGAEKLAALAQQWIDNNKNQRREFFFRANQFVALLELADRASKSWLAWVLAFKLLLYYRLIDRVNGVNENVRNIVLRQDSKDEKYWSRVLGPMKPSKDLNARDVEPLFKLIADSLYICLEVYFVNGVAQHETSVTMYGSVSDPRVPIVHYSMDNRIYFSALVKPGKLPDDGGTAQPSEAGQIARGSVSSVLAGKTGFFQWFS